MGKDKKAKQQKRAQKSAKTKTRKSQHKKQILAHGDGLPAAWRGALHAPLYECWEPAELFDDMRGIGTVIITRKTEHRQILIGTFMLDVYCLGVKDAFIRLASEQEYHNFLQQARMHERLQTVSPERARKLIESAEAYASDLGFKPHRDYQKAKKIFGDIDPNACPDGFEFGRNGKPLYFVGPYDSPQKQERIVRTLTEKLGPGNFDYVISPFDQPPMEFLE